MLTTASLAMITTNAIFMVISGSAVALRILARKKKSLPLAADDYFIIAAWILSLALAITNIVGVPVGGFGVSFDDLSDEKVTIFLKILFVMQFWYILAVAFVKFSILCLYGRIFSSSASRFPVVIKIILALTFGWLISFLFATFFQVWPIRCNWTDCYPTTNYPVMYVVCSVTDIILDISILCLPASFIMKLRMSRHQKVGLAGIFGLGIFCVVSSVARLVYAVKTVEGNLLHGSFASSIGEAIVNIIMWSGIEACASIVCANLPCYTAFVGMASFRYFINSFSTIFSFGSRSNSYFKRSRKTSHDTASSEQIVDSGVKTVIQGAPHNTPGVDLEMGKISVQTTTDTREHSSHE